MVSVKATAYAEHVSEYGVHWSFFFTLAAVSVAASVLSSVLPHRWLPPVGVLVIAGMWSTAVQTLLEGVLNGIVYAAHEICLVHLGVAEYVEDAPRVGLVSANKEGLVSLGGSVPPSALSAYVASVMPKCTGYLGLYLVGLGIGRVLLERRDIDRDPWRLPLVLAAIACVTSGALLLAQVLAAVALLRS